MKRRQPPSPWAAALGRRSSESSTPGSSNAWAVAAPTSHVYCQDPCDWAQHHRFPPPRDFQALLRSAGLGTSLELTLECVVWQAKPDFNSTHSSDCLLTALLQTRKCGIFSTCQDTNLCALPKMKRKLESKHHPSVSAGNKLTPFTKTSRGNFPPPQSQLLAVGGGPCVTALKSL